MTLLRSVKSQNHGIRGGATDETFQEQRFLRERGASVVAEFDFFNFQDLTHAQGKYKAQKERKRTKSIIGLIYCWLRWSLL